MLTGFGNQWLSTVNILKLLESQNYESMASGCIIKIVFFQTRSAFVYTR